MAGGAPEPDLNGEVLLRGVVMPPPIGVEWVGTGPPTDSLTP